MTTDNYCLSTTAAPGRALPGWIGRAQAKWARNRKTARTWRALRTLPDYALLDIGIHRSEIGGVTHFERFMDRF